MCCNCQTSHGHATLPHLCFSHVWDVGLEIWLIDAVYSLLRSYMGRLTRCSAKPTDSCSHDHLSGPCLERMNEGHYPQQGSSNGCPFIFPWNPVDIPVFASFKTWCSLKNLQVNPSKFRLSCTFQKTVLF